jgi:hypothetical protein
MRHINSNIYPKEGFYFRERDNATIRGDSWPGVIARVKNYRKRAGYEPGNPDVEVIEQACARNPGLCHEDNPAYQEKLKAATLKTRVLRWFADIQARMKGEPLTFASEFDAKNRANVCVLCPYNKSLPDGCASCKAAVQESRKNVIGARFVDARVHCCDVLGEDINVTRWLEQQTLDNGELPGHCWRKRTL